MDLDYCENLKTTMHNLLIYRTNLGFIYYSLSEGVVCCSRNDLNNPLNIKVFCISSTKTECQYSRHFYLPDMTSGSQYANLMSVNICTV